MTIHIAPPSLEVPIAEAIANPAQIIYVTYGSAATGRWKTATSYLGTKVGIQLFLVETFADMEAIAWPAERKRADGSPLGNHTPKGVFINRDGTLAVVMTGRSARRTGWLGKAFELAGGQ